LFPKKTSFGGMARITINTSATVHAAAKKRARGKFQSVSQYVSQLIDDDLKARAMTGRLLEEQQAAFHRVAVKDAEESLEKKP
jgi:Arc/MetJ-type ribon-helix-helix transcriptional regulator